MVEEYKDGDSQIIFSQMTFSHFNGTRINTETAEDAITAVDVNGITALYFENMLVWNNDEYVFSFQANKLGKDELIALSESVKPKQWYVRMHKTAFEICAFVQNNPKW